MHGRGPLLSMLAVLGLSAISAFRSTEVRLTETSKQGAPAHQQFAKSAAYDGGFVVVFEDYRAGPAYVRVMLEALAGDGGSLREHVLGDGFLQEWDPSVACIDTRCLAAWCRLGSGPVTRLVDVSAGTMGPERLLQAHEWQLITSVASDGARFLVVWNAVTGIMGQLVDGSGAPLGAPMTIVSDNAARSVHLEPGPGGYLLTWRHDLTEVRATKLDPDGASDGGYTPLGTIQSYSYYWPVSSVAVDGGFVVAWEEPSRVVVRRLDVEGGPIDPTPVQLAVAASSDAAPRLARGSGNGFIVVYLDSAWRWSAGEWRFADLDLVRPPAAFAGRSGPLRPWLTASPGGPALLSWDDYRGRGSFGQRSLVQLSPSFVELNARPAGDLPDTHWSAAAAPWVDGGFVLGWLALEGDTGRPRVRIVDPSGRPVGDEVALEPEGGRPEGLVLVRTARGVRAVWYAAGSIRTMELIPASDGGHTPVLSPVELVASVNEAFPGPRAAVAGGRTSVAWLMQETHEVWQRFIEADGGLSAASRLVAGSRHKWLAQGTGAGHYWLALLRDTGELSVSRVSEAGTLLDGTAATVASDVNGVAMASDDREVLLVWTESLSPPRVRGAFGHPDGGLRAPFTIRALPLPRFHESLFVDEVGAAVVFDGADYVVTWSERVSDGGLVDIFARRVATDGGLAPVTPIAWGAAMQQGPAVAVSGGRTLIVHLTPGPSEVARVHGAVFSDTPVEDEAGPGAAAPDAGGSSGADGGGGAGGIDSGDAPPRREDPRRLTVGCTSGPTGAADPAGFPMILLLVGLAAAWRVARADQSSGPSGLRALELAEPQRAQDVVAADAADQATLLCDRELRDVSLGHEAERLRRVLAG